jgi:hypothetical protein
MRGAAEPDEFFEKRSADCGANNEPGARKLTSPCDIFAVNCSVFVHGAGHIQAPSRYDGVMDQLKRIHEILQDAVNRGELWACSDLAEVEALLEEHQFVFELAAWAHEKSKHSEEEAEAAFVAFFEAHTRQK